jgi:hypothetical protein
LRTSRSRRAWDRSRRPSASGVGGSRSVGSTGSTTSLAPGAPRRIGDDQIAETIRRTLEEVPPDATHWSLRGMAGAMGYAPSTIYRIWRAFGLQPHRSETFKLSSDPFFVDKVRDIVGLYLTPPDRGTAETARTITDMVPSAKLVVYPSGGHIWLGHGRDVADTITGFLRLVSDR